MTLPAPDDKEQRLRFEPPASFSPTQREEWIAWQKRTRPRIFDFSSTDQSPSERPPVAQPLPDDTSSDSSLLSPDALVSSTRPALAPPPKARNFLCCCNVSGNADEEAALSKRKIVQCERCEMWSHGKCASDKQWQRKDHRFVCDLCRNKSQVDSIEPASTLNSVGIHSDESNVEESVNTKLEEADARLQAARAHPART